MKPTATAINAFISTDDPSFSIKEGDEVTIIDKDAKGWYYGSFNGNKGWFPSNCVSNQKDSIMFDSNQKKESLPFSSSLKNLLGSSLPAHWQLSTMAGGHVSYVNVLTNEIASSLTEVYEKNSWTTSTNTLQTTAPVTNQSSNELIFELNKEWELAIDPIITSIQELDSILKEQNPINTISQSCHIASLVYNVFTDQEPNGISSNSINSGMKRILIKLGKLIVASIVLNSYWYLSDSKDNAVYQASQVALALNSYRSFQSSLHLFPKSSKISRDEFKNLFIEYIIGEFKNQSEFLSNEVFISLSWLKKSVCDSGSTKYEVFRNIGILLQALGIFISYTEVLGNISGIKRESALLNMSEKRTICINIINGSLLYDSENINEQINILKRPDFVEIMTISIKELMNALEKLVSLQLHDPLKIYECISVMDNEASKNIRKSYLSYAEWSRLPESETESISAIYPQNRESKSLESHYINRTRESILKNDISAKQSFAQAIERIIEGSGEAFLIIIVIDIESMKGFLLCFHLFGSGEELIAVVTNYLREHEQNKTIILNAAKLLATWAEHFWVRTLDSDHLNDIYRFFKIDFKDKIEPKIIHSVLLMLSKVKHNSGKADLPQANLPKPILPKLKSWKLYDIDKREVSRQICLIEMELFLRIQPDELLKQKWAAKNKQIEASNVRALVSFSTKMSEWIIRSVLEEDDIRQRANILKFFVRICGSLMSLSNYNAVFAINSALSSSSIDRLQKTWDLLPEKYHTTLEMVRQTINYSKNFHAYRQTLNCAKLPCIPFLGLFLTDLTFLDDGNPDYIKGQINMDKCDRHLKIIENFQLYQTQPYEFQKVADLRERLLTFINVEKIHDQDVLYERSLFIEPKESNNSQIRKTMNGLQKTGIL